MQELITKHWLTDILQVSGINTQITNYTVEEVHAYNPRSGKYQIHLTHQSPSDSLPSTLFMKRASEPHETRFYTIARQHSDKLQMVVPCYYTHLKPDDNVIVLRDLSNTHIAHPPAQLPPHERHCEQIVDGLADLHAYWWDHPELETIFRPADDRGQIQSYVDEIQQYYQEFADYLGDRLPQSRRDIYTQVFEHLVALRTTRFEQRKHLTLTFEDVHIGNFLYPKQSDDHLYFIDWEQWGINIGMNDLAYMMAMFWSRERRQRLEQRYLKRYHQRIQSQGITDYSWQQLWDDYRLSIIYHLMGIIWTWRYGAPIDVWWNNLERLTSAYVELDCEKLLV